jgi:putative ABC transport system permease protein
MKRIFRLSIGKRGVRRDVDAEIRFHLEMRTEEFIAQGMDRREAREAARAAFGDVKGVAQQCQSIRARHQRRLQALEFAADLVRDFRFAVRSLRRSPGYTLAVLLTLALGIGANTAAFSLVNGVLIRPLPFQDGEQLLHLRQPASGAGIDDAGFSPVEIADYRARSEALEGIVEYHSMSFTLLGLGEPQRVQTGVVSAEFFDLFGVQPILGRTFLPSDDREGADAVLLLSFGYWQRAFDGDAGVIGRKLRMNDRVHTVVGVLPPVPQYPHENDVYMPVSSCPFRSGVNWSTSRDARGLDVFARLRTGNTLSAARAELSTVADRLHDRYPANYSAAADFSTTAVALREELVHHARPKLLMLLGITGFLLLIVCANVANLTLARLMRREREIAIRAALGAGRGRLFRQLLAEGTLMAMLGGGLALLLGHAGLSLLVSFVARFTPRAGEISIDSTVMLFTLGVSLLTGLVLGLLPTIPARASLAADLSDGNGPATAGARRARARSLLIAWQVAGSFVLLIGAGLLIRSFVKLQQVDPGFDTENVLTVRLPLDWSNYRERERSGDFAARLLARTERLPATISVAVANKYPLSGQGPWSLGIRIDGRPRVDGAARSPVDIRAVSPSYFHTLGVPLVRGRLFVDQEPGTFPREAVINQTLARRHFSEEEPLGQRVCLSDACEDWITIVGVVGDVKAYGLESATTEEIYVPFASLGWRDFRLLIRTRDAPLSVAEQVQSLVRDLDPTIPVTEVRTISQARSESVAAPRLTMLLMGLFAALALAVTAAGIGGIIAYTVNSRRRELGIRMAMGAESASVVRMVIKQALSLVLAGLAVGVPAALVLSRSLDGLLFETPAYDPLTFSAVAALLILVAVAASLVPAKRAVSIDPILTLKND